MTLPAAPLMPSVMDYLELDANFATEIGERLYPVQADQGAATPWIAFRLDNEDREYSIDGAAEMYMADVVFTIASDLYREAHQVSKLLSNVLDGFRGVMGDIAVKDIRFMDSRDGESKDEVLDLYLVICEVSIWYTDA